MLKQIYYLNNWDIKTLIITTGLLTKQITPMIITLLIIQTIYTTTEIIKWGYKKVKK